HGRGDDDVVGLVAEPPPGVGLAETFIDLNVLPVAGRDADRLPGERTDDQHLPHTVNLTSRSRRAHPRGCTTLDARAVRPDRAHAACRCTSNASRRTCRRT